MQRLVLPVLLAALFTPSAFAQPEGWDISGDYHGSGEGEISASFERIEGDTFNVSLDTIAGDCSGTLTGEMDFTLDGGVLQVANPNYKEGDDSYYGSAEFCEVTMTFDEDGFLNLEESSGCNSFHGAACSFDGQVVSMRAAG